MYDLIIIGGGPAGYYGAEKAQKAGLSTLLVEKRYLGGVCLNEGCIPSKTLLYSSKLYSLACHSQRYGIIAQDVSFDCVAVMTRKQKVIETLRNGIAFTLKKCGVTVVNGAATVCGQKNDIFTVSVDGTTYEGKRLLLCTGAEAIRPPLAGIDQDFVCTNREILSVATIPKTMVVIGGGAIGLELATFFAETGTNVTVVEMMPHIGGQLDKEIGLALKRELEKKGITFVLQSRVTVIGDRYVTVETNGALQNIDAEIVLVSVGRKPVVAGFGLESIGVLVEKGAIKTDACGRTNIANVWAAGDVNGKSMLAHTAYREAQVCIDNMLGKESHVNYAAIPSVIYTHPEIATVGLTKDEALASGKDVQEVKMPLAYSGRYLAETDGERGMMKAIVDAQSKQILGIHAMGGQCSEMIFGAASMVEQQQTVSDVSSIVFPHPSVSEIIKDNLMQAM